MHCLCLSVRVLAVLKLIDLIALWTVIQRHCDIAALLGNQKYQFPMICSSLWRFDIARVNLWYASLIFNRNHKLLKVFSGSCTLAGVSMRNALVSFPDHAELLRMAWEWGCSLTHASHLQFLNWLHNCSNKNLEGRGILRLEMSCYLNVRFLADQVSSEVGLNEDGGLYLRESSREGERRAWAVVCVHAYYGGK